MLAAAGCIGDVPAHFLGLAAETFRAVLFNKTAKTNWSLARHQDRTICVKAKREVEGFGPWTVKQGLIHVAPPVALLREIITVRVHLADVALLSRARILASKSQQ